MAETSIRRFYGTETDRIDTNEETLRVGDTFQINGGQYRFYVWLGEKWMLLNSPLEKSLENQRSVTWSGISTNTEEVEIFLDGVEGNRLGILPGQIVYFKIDFVPVLENGNASDMYRIDSLIKRDGVGLTFSQYQLDPQGNNYNTEIDYIARFPVENFGVTNFGWGNPYLGSIGFDDGYTDENNLGEDYRWIFIGKPKLYLDTENNAMRMTVASYAPYAINGNVPVLEGFTVPMTWKVTGYLTTLTI